MEQSPKDPPRTLDRYLQWKGTYCGLGDHGGSGVECPSGLGGIEAGVPGLISDLIDAIHDRRQGDTLLQKGASLWGPPAPDDRISQSLPQEPIV